MKKINVTNLKNPNNDKDIIFKDCICDAFLQNILLKPKDYDVIATTNLNGDYVSDSLACVGGIGISPGANINYTTGEAVLRQLTEQHQILPGKILLIQVH